MRIIPAIPIILLLSVCREVLSQTNGDIRLKPYTLDPTLKDHYLVEMYYSDGTSAGSYGSVCADETYDTEGKVICHQLGYQYKGFTSRRIPNYPVWFTHIDCDDSNISHILRCKVKVATGAVRTRSTCALNELRLLVSCDFDNPLPRYDGQVMLCPVNNDSSTRVSTSYGLVGIFYDKYKATQGISQINEHPLGGEEADTICRNLGFTGAYPLSAVRKDVDKHDFSYCFSNTGTRPPHKFNHRAWLRTDDIKCDGTQRCIGCCMKSPPGSSCAECQNPNNSIVIRCVFDRTKKIPPDDGTGDRSKDCKLDKNNHVVQCVHDKTQQLIKNLRISLGFIIVALIIIVISCCCYCGCKYVHYGKYNRIENVDIQQQN